MNESINYYIFIIASWALIITPGPDLIYVLTRGISHGRRAGIISAAGVTTGILFHTLFSAMGLSVILQKSAMAFMLVKYTGAAYLVLIGFKALLNKTEFNTSTETKTLSGNRLFIQGFMSNIFNPKVALFFLAFLPQFINPSASNFSLQIILLGFLFAFFCIIFLVLVGYSAGKIGIWLSANALFRKTIRWISGSIMILLGLRLAVYGKQ